MTNEQRKAIGRIVFEIISEMTETGMTPLVLVYGVPGTDKANPLKVKTAFDYTAPEHIRDAKELAIKAIQESL